MSSPLTQRHPDTPPALRQNAIGVCAASISRIVKKSLAPACAAVCLSSTAFAQNLVIDDFLASSAAPFESLKFELDADTASTSIPIVNVGTLGSVRIASIAGNYPSNTPEKISYVVNTTPFISADSGRASGTSLNTPPRGDIDSDADWEFLYYANGAGLATDVTPFEKVVLLWESQNTTANNDSSVSLALEDSLGNAHTQTFTFLEGTLPQSTQVLTTEWDLSTFSAAGVDLTDIDRITLSGNTANANDIVFSSLTLVPEPSTTVMIALSFGIFLTRRKRSC